MWAVTARVNMPENYITTELNGLSSLPKNMGLNLLPAIQICKILSFRAILSRTPIRACLPYSACKSFILFTIMLLVVIAITTLP